MKWLGKKDKADERAQHYDAGVRLAGDGKFEEAVSEFKQALKTGPSSCDLYWRLGAAFIALERWTEALNACNKAISIDPFISEPWRQLGAIHDHAGNFVEALKVYVTAISLEPKDYELRNDLGIAYFNIGGYKEAIKAFKQSLLMNNATNGRAHYYLGLVYIDLKDRASATSAYDSLNEIGRTDLASDLHQKIQAEL
jgi:tetratricopeptide (TPR) repeat protein